MSTLLFSLATAPEGSLTQRVYNVGAFNPSAGEIRDYVLEAFPRAEISFVPDVARARIVDTWPADVDDSPARNDWGWQPDYDAERAFHQYLVPTISRHYEAQADRK